MTVSNVPHVSVQVVLCLRPELMVSHLGLSTLALQFQHLLEPAALLYQVCLEVFQAGFLPLAGHHCLLLWQGSTLPSSSQVQVNRLVVTKMLCLLSDNEEC